MIFKWIMNKLRKLLNNIFLRRNKQFLLKEGVFNENKNIVYTIDNSKAEIFYKMLAGLHSNKELQLLTDVVNEKNYI